MSTRSLVIGSASGLGREIALNLKRRGHEVFTHARSAEQGYELVGDTSTEDFRVSLKNLLSSNAIDIIFFSVGSYTGATSPNLDFEELESAYKNNLLSGIAIIDTVVTAWIGKTRGKLVIINSIAALTPNPNEAVYGAMKRALSHFTNSVRLGVLSEGIEIIEVFPGAMKTRMTKNRRGWQDLMDPSLVADTIVDLAIQKNFSVPTVEIRNTPK
jgi:short-subunit dehydrogenase